MRRVAALLALVLASVTIAFGQSNLKVVLAGTIQAPLGGANWTPADESTRMTEAEKGVYEFVAALPKGNFEYKVAIGGTWDENYGKNNEKGGQNIALVVPADNTVVKFVFDAGKKTIVDSINQPDQVKAPATAPARAGPAAQAAPAAQPAAGDSTTLVIHYKRLKGDYEGWNVWSWPYKPQGGEGKAYQFEGQDAFGRVATIVIPGKHDQLGVIIRKGDWEKKDIDTDRFVTVQPGGRTEIWALEGIKDFFPSLQAAQANVEPPKLPAFLDSSTRIRAVLFAPIDPAKDAGLVTLTVGGKAVPVKSVTNAAPPRVAAGTDSVDPSKVVLPGTIQAALGGAEWNPNGDITRMTEVSPGVFEFVAAFPAGAWEYKVARGGAWTENYGEGGEPNGANIPLNVPKDGT
ncbi:MAG TPA: pullulanase-associated domain-containing protein, partial [Deinococcales bacterium]|nr:pullulanase-associated domain-containing protein [Deinococcales bacterium]